MTSHSERDGHLARARRITFVGPDPRASTAAHAGGQLTAAIGIAGYAAKQGYALDVIDTFVDSFSPPSFGRKLRFGVARVRDLWRLLASGSTDGVILFVGARHSFFERVLLAGLARLAGVVSVFCIRDGGFTGWMRGSPLLRRLVLLLLRIPQRIVVQGNRTRQILVDAGVPARKLAVVRNWLPETFGLARQGRAAAPGEPLRLIFVGWLVKEKGLRELMEACASLAKRHRFDVDLIGGGSLESDLRASVAANGLAGIRFLGWRSADEIRGRLEQAHIFVLPSYFEGFPNALLEAMACGLPSVCSDVGAIAESVQQGISGYVVPPQDAVALAAAIENYLVTPTLVQRHGSAALGMVRTLHDRETNLKQLFSCLF